MTSRWPAQLLLDVLRPARRTEAEEQVPQRPHPAAAESSPTMRPLRGITGSPRTGLPGCQVRYTVSSQRIRSSSDRRSMLGSVTRMVLPLSIFTR